MAHVLCLSGVYDQEKRCTVMDAAARGELEHSWVPGSSAGEEKEKQRARDKAADHAEDDLADRTSWIS